MENVVGVAVKVTTSLGEVVEGTIFAYDANTNCVVLGACAHPPACLPGRAYLSVRAGARSLSVRS